MEATSAQLPGVPAYNGTIFLSYARADDETPPSEKPVEGWVTFFWNQLRFEVINAGAHQATLWLDRHQIEPVEDFNEKIEAALREARLIVPILSPNWVQRPMCLQEVTRFCELHPRANDNIGLVVKKEPPDGTIPAVLKNREGYRFFDNSRKGGPRDFYWRGLKDETAYFDVLKRIADWIYERLTDKTARQTVPVAEPNGRVLFVALAADELRDARQRLVNDLSGSGYKILPDEDRLPDTAVEAERVVRDALCNAELAIHLLGEREGVTPGGGEESILRLQLRLAREHAGAAGRSKFTRLLWAPKWLPDQSQGKRDPFAVVDRFGGRQPDEEIFGEEITDLSQLLRRRLKGLESSPERACGPSLLLVAGAAAVDDELVSTLANRLQGGAPQVRPVFFGEPLPAVDAPTPPTVLVPWGEADPAAIEVLLAGAKVVTNHITVLRLPGGDEAAKRRFFVDGVYVERLDVLPADRHATRELLVGLDILEAAAGAES